MSEPTRPKWAQFPHSPWIQDLVDMRLDDFKNHQASLREGPGLIRVDWKKPGTGIMSGTYIWTDRSYLLVYGDFSDHVYWPAGWPPDLGGLQGFGDSDLRYFAEKSQQAGKDGQLSWFEEKAKRFVELDVLEHAKEYGRFEVYQRLLPEMMEAINSQDEWINWLGHGMDNEKEALFGDCWWEWAGSPGMDTSPGVITHWVGLRLAVEQLLAKEQAK